MKGWTKMWPVIVGAIITAFIVAKDAKAEAFVAENKQGGEIVLTDRPCKLKDQTYDGLFEAYVWGPSSPMEKGCWTMVDKMVHVVYEKTGERRVYDPNLFRKK